MPRCFRTVLAAAVLTLAVASIGEILLLPSCFTLYEIGSFLGSNSKLGATNTSQSAQLEVVHRTDQNHTFSSNSILHSLTQSSCLTPTATYRKPNPIHTEHVSDQEVFITYGFRHV